RSDPRAGGDLRADLREPGIGKSRDRTLPECALGVAARNRQLEEEESDRRRNRLVRKASLVCGHVLEGRRPCVVAEKLVDRVLREPDAYERLADRRRSLPIHDGSHAGDSKHLGKGADGRCRGRPSATCEVWLRKETPTRV